uniref:Uncharacterized protein n=1 Tax=viral metagenome TaxID=1070528 RepID=A0A6M3KDS5_9ZZZZ
MSNAELNEIVGILATIDPDNYAAAAYTSDWVPLQDLRRAMFIVMVGDMGTNGTVDFKLQEATDSSGTGATDITGKSITQLTQAGTDDNKQAIIEIDASELTDGYPYVAAVMTVGTAASDAAAICLAGDARFKPASDFDLSSVDEIVT